MRFRNRDLYGAAFAGSDLRGADFTGADLRDADLREARTGMRRGWAALLVGLGLAASVGLGLVAGALGHRIEGMLVASNVVVRGTGVLVASGIFVFLGGLVWKGPRYVVFHVLPAFATLALVTAITARVVGFGSGAGAVAFLVLSLAGLVVVALGALARAVAGTAGQFFFVVVAIAGMVAARTQGGGVLAAILIIASVIAGQRTLRASAGFPLLDEITRTLACHGGTSFRGADLRGARFDGARLSAADFRGARMEGARFDGARATFCRGLPGEAPAAASGLPGKRGFGRRGALGA